MFRATLNIANNKKLSVRDRLLHEIDFLLAKTHISSCLFPKLTTLRKMLGITQPDVRTFRENFLAVLAEENPAIFVNELSSIRALLKINQQNVSEDEKATNNIFDELFITNPAMPNHTSIRASSVVNAALLPLCSANIANDGSGEDENFEIIDRPLREFKSILEAYIKKTKDNFKLTANHSFLASFSRLDRDALNHVDTVKKIINNINVSLGEQQASIDLNEEDIKVIRNKPLDDIIHQQIKKLGNRNYFGLQLAKEIKSIETRIAIRELTFAKMF